MVKAKSNRVWVFVAVMAVGTAPLAAEVTSVNAVGYLDMATYESQDSIQFAGLQVTEMVMYTDNLVQSAVGTTERNTVSASVKCVCDAGMGPVPGVVLSGPMVMDVALKAGITTGSMFATEIVSMSLSGNVGGLNVTVRESPTYDSTGELTVTDIGGQYHIDSFFDVFTELSVGGGGFFPAESSAHFNITPEPATMTLLAIGGLCMLARRRRK